MNTGSGPARGTVRRVLAGLLALSLVVAGYSAASGASTAPSVSSVRAAADLSAGYMQRAVGSSGKFVYEIDMDDGDVSSSYNILRHAGSIWSMCDYYGSRPSPEMRSAILRAGGYMRDRRVRPVAGMSGLQAVWSYPEDDGDEPAAKLGGTGLGLVALTSVERVSPGFTPMSTMRSMGRFLVYMQRSDGSFYTQYDPSRSGRVTTPPSLYYPGEAALGLLMLYEIDPNPLWIQSASKALAYLARSRTGQTDLPADHWALIATEKLQQLAPRAGSQVQVPMTLLVNHAIQISEAILRSQLSSGGFSSTGGTTATATRLEGLQAALATLPAGHSLRPKIQASVAKGMAFLLSTQVETGRYAGAFPSTVGGSDVRIDCVQHPLSAMLKYVRQND